MIEPMYVCVYVPEFPAQARLRLRPELAKTPVVILAGDPPLEVVCSTNALASNLGVKRGMTRAEMDSFTDISILRRSEQEELSARAALLEVAGGFTPRFEVNLSKSTAFIVMLDMAGTTRVFGPPSQALASIKEALFVLKVFAQLAASANFHVACCIAPLARTAPIIVPPGKEQEHLRTVPLAALPLTSSQFEMLDLWGLHTLGDLAALPEVELVVRLGQAGKRLHLMACGQHPHLLVPEETAFLLEEHIDFDAPIEVMDSLLFVLGPLLDQLLVRAQNRSYALAGITVRFGLDGGGDHECSVKPALPVLQRDILLKLLHLDLQTHPPPAGVLSIFLHAEPGDRSKVQLGLFAPQQPEPLRLDVTLARIAALVGEDRVGQARLSDTHRSNDFTIERFIAAAGLPGGQRKVLKAPHVTALRRYRPPVLLSVQQHGNRLEAFSFQGKRYNVRKAYGPWRKSGDWWSTAVWSCEEWDVCATTSDQGAETSMLCVITHDLLQHHWHLEALYD